MTGRKLRSTLFVLGTSLSVFTAPSESKAFWDLFHHHAPTVAYMPLVVAPPCAPCGQVCNYIPQTCYRTVYVNMPVTAYQPVSIADPCTGCPRICMRPVTTYVPQAQLIPYTTYSPVMANVCNYCPCTNCGACATGCPTVTNGTGTASSVTPTQKPTLPPSSETRSAEPERTFEQKPSDAEPDTSNSAKQVAPPRRLDLQDRMTARPTQQAWAYKLVSAPAATHHSAPAADVDFDDWQAAP